jgi:hypothetical protein
LLGVSGIASGIVSSCRSNSAIQDRRRLFCSIAIASAGFR